jgi:hypothetical protein
MIEPGEVKKYYEWKTGFRAGVVECYLCDAEDNVYFESGRFVNKNNLENELYSISEEEYLEKSNKQESVENQQQEWASLLGNEDEVQMLQPVESPKSNYVPPIQIEEKSPIQIILEKQKKKEKRSIDISLDIEIPTTKVIELLTVMFDEDEVYEEIISQAVSAFSADDIKNLIQNSIIKTIKEIQGE